MSLFSPAVRPGFIVPVTFQGEMLLFALAAACLSRVHKVLVVLNPSVSEASGFSLFFSDLLSLGCNFSYVECNSTIVQLERFGERLYDTVVVLAGASACFGHGADELTRFLDNGGNAFVFNSKPPNDIQDKLYRHFSLRVTTAATLSDISGNNPVILRNVLAPRAIVGSRPAPLVFEGGFGTIDRPNDFRIPIVAGGLEHVLNVPDRSLSTQVYAHDLIPIYALQGRTGGRVVFVHSANFATDDFFDIPVTLNETLQALEKPQPNGNRQLLKELSEYVTHYKSHARITSVNHFATATGKTPVQYHIRQNVTVVADLESVWDGEWKPDQDSLQVEIFMLGTFIRRHMKLVRPGHFEETLSLPDRAGNFKIKVFTAREGWFNAREEMAIAIRPLAIREKEKFLFCAKPYQLSMVLVMAAAFLAAVHFLYHRPTD
jgi:hypothetical protein